MWRIPRASSIRQFHLSLRGKRKADRPAWRFTSCEARQRNDGNRISGSTPSNTVLLYVVAKGAVGHAEKFGSLNLYAVGAAQSFFDKTPLQVFHIVLEVEAFIRKMRD